MATTNTTTMNEKMFALAKQAENAAKDLHDGKYSNNTYSAFSGDRARRAFTAIQEELEKLAKEMLRMEVLAEANKPIIPSKPELTIPEGYEEMFAVITENLEKFGQWRTNIQTDTEGEMRLGHILKSTFIPCGYEVRIYRNYSWVYFAVEQKY